MQSGGPDRELLSESENRVLKMYGKLPRGGLLAQRSKVLRLQFLVTHAQERTYFDSGDFALSAANRETGNDAIQTGRTHPHRESISHPYASIPASSNVDEDANHDTYRKSAGIEKSPLLYQTTGWVMGGLFLGRTA
ncbi:Endosulphine [Penicillium freii]|nr:Endosulphine [Penicillium freii]